MVARNTLVNFIGLGSKAAVPVVYAYVKEHPQACIYAGDPGFFTDAKIYARGLGWYEGCYKKQKNQTVCGELSESYLASSQAAGLIARTYPNARLFAVINNPLVAVRVAYVEARHSGRVNSSVTLAMFLKQNPEVLLRACYGRQLAHYFSYYAGTDLLVVTDGDVRYDLLGTITKIYDFLGLNKDFVPASLAHLVPEEEIDPKKRPGIIKRTINLVKSIVKKVYGKIIYVIRPVSIPTDEALAVAMKIPLTQELEDYLKKYYEADVRQLSALLHRDLLVEWNLGTFRE